MAKAAEWLGRVEAWRASGSTAQEYCEGKDFAAKNLLWWSSHFRRAGGKKRQASSGVVRLARVVRSASTAPAALVVHVGDARVEVSSEAQVPLLAAVLEAMVALKGEQR